MEGGSEVLPITMKIIWHTCLSFKRPLGLQLLLKRQLHLADLLLPILGLFYVC